MKLIELTTPAEQITTLDVLTLVVAIVGLALSVVAVVWQIVSWRFTGWQVKVRATPTMTLMNAQGIQQAIT